MGKGSRPKKHKGKKSDVFAVQDAPKAHGNRRACVPVETGPTKETAAKVNVMPTCYIQRAVKLGLLSDEMGQGVEEYGIIRHKAGMSGKRYKTTLGQFEPQSVGGPIDEEARAQALGRYMELTRHLTAAEFFSLSTLLEQSEPLDIDATQSGARKMRDILIFGVDRMARSA